MLKRVQTFSRDPLSFLRSMFPRSQNYANTTINLTVKVTLKRKFSKFSTWPPAMACKKSAIKIGADVDIPNFSVFSRSSLVYEQHFYVADIFSRDVLWSQK